MHPLNQSDLRWGLTLIGNSSGSTCASVGCVVTSLTMAVNALRAKSFIPPDLRPGGAAGLTTFNYTPGSAAMVLETAAERLQLKIAGRVRSSARDAAGLANMRRLIDDALAKKGLAILRIDYDPSSPADNHSIVCFGKFGSEYFCADPAGGVSIALDQNLFCQRTSSKAYFCNGVAPIFRA